MKTLIIILIINVLILINAAIDYFLKEKEKR